MRSTPGRPAPALEGAADLRAELVQGLGDRLGPAVSMATTEHFNLQTARAATISEANGRASIYLAALSSNLIALAFIGQMSRLGTAFYAFSLLLLPVLAFVGVVTFQRLVQSSLEDIAYAQRIAGVRNLYVALVPELEPHLLVVRARPAESLLHGERLRPSRWQLTLTTARHGRGGEQRGDWRLRRSRRGRTGRRIAGSHARGRSNRRGIGASGAPEAPPTRTRRLRARDDRSGRHSRRRYSDGRRWLHPSVTPR